MDRAVSISVTAIDTEYGFTIVNILDQYTGNILATLSISAETWYGPDENPNQSRVTITRHSDNVQLKEHHA
jgi:hypothetical protein